MDKDVPRCFNKHLGDIERHCRNERINQSNMKRQWMIGLEWEINR